MAMIGIVPEVLKEENYEFWKVCLKSYLVGQGLWDIVSKEVTSDERANAEWKKKNALALHAIQLACGSNAYSKYKKETHVSAKFAWDHLVEKHHGPSRTKVFSHDEHHASDASGRKEYLGYEHLYNAIQNDEIKRVREILEHDSKATKAIVSSHGDTALHVAILAGNVKIALELVKKMHLKDLEIANEFGATAFSYAAISENTKLARAMVQKNHKLVTIKNGHEDEGSLPVIVASMYGRKRMVHFLFSKTPKELFDPATTNGLDGATLLNNLITADFFDVASMLLKLYPKLGVTADYNGEHSLRILAHKPSAFPSGSKFSLWKHFIYKCVQIHSPWDAKFLDEHVGIETSNGAHSVIDIDHLSDEDFNEGTLKATTHFLHELGWILLRTFVPSIKQLHDTKLINDEANKLLKCIFKEIRGMSSSDLEKMEIDKAVHVAIKHGIVEFIEELLEYNPEFIWRKDKKGRTIFSHAIVLRQEKIFNLIYRLGTKKSIVASRHDIFRNNFLHLAAKLSPPNQLDRVSGAALQMQRELQWFKEVESIVQPKYRDQVNESNMKPSTLFTEEHKDLAKEGEKWMKNTAGSSMIVGTLIAAVMFTTTFTVPGGNDDRSGLPIMLKTDRNAFMIFMISNGLSLFTSCTSVLMFLGILTARYREEDFLVSLPTKLIFGIACLFISMVTMMISFASSLYLILHETLSWVSIPIIVLSAFPVLLFSALQFPLLIEMIVRTYVTSVFDRPKKHILFGIRKKNGHLHHLH